MVIRARPAIWTSGFVQTRKPVRGLYEAIKRFGAPLHDLDAADLSHPGVVFQIGVPPVRIDILTALSGLRFEQDWANRSYVEWDGLKIPVISRLDLIRNKRSTGRTKDLADAEQLEMDGTV
jgi:hypothetical protein